MTNYYKKLSEKDKLVSEQLAGECLEESIRLLRSCKLNEAARLAQRAISIWDETQNLRKKASGLLVLSVISSEMSSRSLSMEYILDALEVAGKIHAYDILAKIYNNIGSKFMYLKAYDRALLYFEKASEAFENIPAGDLKIREDLTDFIFILNMNLADTYCQIGDFEKARYHYHIVKEKAADPLCEEYLFTFRTFEGILLWRIGDTAQAEALVDSIMQAVDETEYAIDYLESAAEYIELLKNMKDFERWQRALTIVDEHISQNKSVQSRLHMTAMWIEFYKASGNRKKYYDTCSSFYELSREIEILDYDREAAGLELQADSREAKKQSEKNDDLLYRDPLTGIGNRNKMLKDSEAIIAESVRKRTNITVGLIDVDFFKECNDTYGHIEGDECLRKVAAMISAAVGSEGSVYRFGGDEFLVLIADVTVQRINEIGNTIKDRLSELQIPNVKSPISPYVTVSQGYTKAVADAGDTIDHLIDLADQILYQVKRRGKNGFLYMKHSEAIEL